MIMKQKDLDRAAKALLTAGKPSVHKRLNPTKEDLTRKFVMRIGKHGKPPVIKEVK